MTRRIVITGLGAVSSLGVGIAPLWEAMVAGRSGIGPTTRFNPAGFSCRLAGEVRDFSAKDFVPKSYRKAVKVMARDTELAVGAAKCASQDAGLVTKAQASDGEAVAPTYPAERLGCHIGAGLMPAETSEIASAMVTAREPSPSPALLASTNGLTLRAWGTVGTGEEPGVAGGMNNLQPLWMLKYLPNMLACHVTIIHGAEGPSNTITCAEASGILSMGESMRVIERNAADVCFSGGAESKVNLMGLMRIVLAERAAPTDGLDGAAVVRPYDPAATGSVPGEAGGLLILEEREAALKRGAKVYAQAAGFAAAHSGGAMIPPLMPAQSINDGLELAILGALKDAGVQPSEVDAIVPQASGNAALDRLEAGALRAVFGDRLASIPLVTVTPFLGDCAAGNGGVMVAIAAMCLKEQRLPARLHAGQCPAGLQGGPSPSRACKLNTILVCSSSLGGQNAALLLKAAV